MDKKFSQSYSKREDALFAKMGSKRLLRWFNNRLSKIDSQEKIWFIVFTRPNHYTKDSKETKWWLKFWLWDSENNSIIGENILFCYLFHAHSEKTPSPEGSDIGECYIQRDLELIVFRPRQQRAHLIFNFSGDLVVQTESNTHIFADENASQESIFVNRDLFAVRSGKGFYLYHLNEKKDDVLPKKTEFLAGSAICISEHFQKFQMIFMGKYCIVSAEDQIPEDFGVTGTILVYTADPDPSRNFYRFASKSSFGNSTRLHNIEATENEDHLIISLECKNVIDELQKNIVLQLPKSILI